MLPGNFCEDSKEAPHRGRSSDTRRYQMENQEKRISCDDLCHFQLLADAPIDQGRDDHQNSAQSSPARTSSSSSIFDIRSLQYLKGNEACDNYQSDANHNDRLEFDPFTRKLNSEDYYNAISILVNNSNLSPGEKDRILMYLARMETCTSTEASSTESTCSRLSTYSNAETTGSFVDDELRCQAIAERDGCHDSVENEQLDLQEPDVDEDTVQENPTEAAQPGIPPKRPLLEWKMSPRIQAGFKPEPVPIPVSANGELKSLRIFRGEDYEDPTLMCNRFHTMI